MAFQFSCANMYCKSKRTDGDGDGEHDSGDSNNDNLEKLTDLQTDKMN